MLRYKPAVRVCIAKCLMDRLSLISRSLLQSTIKKASELISVFGSMHFAMRNDHSPFGFRNPQGDLLLKISLAFTDLHEILTRTVARFFYWFTLISVVLSLSLSFQAKLSRGAVHCSKINYRIICKGKRRERN